MLGFNYNKNVSLYPTRTRHATAEPTARVLRECGTHLGDGPSVFRLGVDKLEGFRVWGIGFRVEKEFYKVLKKCFEALETFFKVSGSMLRARFRKSHSLQGAAQGSKGMSLMETAPVLSTMLA